MKPIIVMILTIFFLKLAHIEEVAQVKRFFLKLIPLEPHTKEGEGQREAEHILAIFIGPQKQVFFLKG